MAGRSRLVRCAAFATPAADADAIRVDTTAAPDAVVAEAVGRLGVVVPRQAAGQQVFVEVDRDPTFS